MHDRFRAAVTGGEVTLGGWMQIGHPTCAEILARAGMDWVCVDLEHGSIDLETVADIFRALEAFGCAAVARIPMNDPIWIRRTLDAGAAGLIIPMVKTAEEAEAAVRQAKYPPRGIRGYGFSRANRYGPDFQRYIATANDRIAMIMQIEHEQAIANLESILSVDGVDAAFIGPYDMSGSMGVVGQLDHPKMIAALETFCRTCKARGVISGMHIVHPSEENVRRALDDGYSLIALGMDDVFLQSAAEQALKAAGRTPA